MVRNQVSKYNPPLLPGLVQGYRVMHFYGKYQVVAGTHLRGSASPADRRRLRERAQMFSVDAAVDHYLKVLLGRWQPAALQPSN